MAESLHPAAENHLPMFITTPGQADVLFILMAVFVLAAVIGLGVIYFRLHALPEHVAWVSMTDEGPVIGNLLLNGIMGKEGAIPEMEDFLMYRPR